MRWVADEGEQVLVVLDEIMAEKNVSFAWVLVNNLNLLIFIDVSAGRRTKRRRYAFDRQ
jgi:hypothetical protein